jgi:hypothetical protein
MTLGWVDFCRFGWGRQKPSSFRFFRLSGFDLCDIMSESLSPILFLAKFLRIEIQRQYRGFSNDVGDNLPLMMEVPLECESALEMAKRLDQRRCHLAVAQSALLTGHPLN